MVGPSTPKIRVGTDLASAGDVAGSIERFGDRYLRRVYSAAELAACTGPDGPSAVRLAARFAAKESVVKALGPSDGGRFTDIEVGVDADGAPTAVLHGGMAQRAAALGLSDSSLSISHHDGLASAVYVAVLASSPVSPSLTETESHV